jgi:hypothetical protein
MAQIRKVKDENKRKEGRKNNTTKDDSNQRQDRIFDGTGISQSRQCGKKWWHQEEREEEGGRKRKEFPTVTFPFPFPFPSLSYIGTPKQMESDRKRFASSSHTTFSSPI